MKHLHTAILYRISNHELHFTNVVPEYSFSKENEITKLSKKFNHGNLDDITRLI